MTGRTAARVGLVAVAAVAVAWLAYDLRALSLDAQGHAAANVARRPAQVDRALSLFAQAARGNADPTPRINEAKFLLSLGRTRQAVDVLGTVTRANPGNVQAWTLLASATVASDPRRFAEANQQLRALFGHPVGSSYQLSSILTPHGVVEVSPGQVKGQVDGVRAIGPVAQFEGWSAAVTERPGGGSSLVPAEEILILSDSRLVASSAPTGARRDVARAYSAPIARVGFTINVPIAMLERAGRRADVEVLASLNGTASELPVNCHPRRQAFGCGQ
jgi:Tetratricopeptide repeat